MFDTENHAVNGKDAATVCCDNYTPGERFLATIKAVKPEGVYITREGVGSGTISPRCWGDGAKRVAALARIQPGDQLEVEVVSWHPETRTLSLVLPGTKKRQVTKTPGWKNGAVKAKRPRKVPFMPIPVGSLLLVDFANLFGELKDWSEQALYVRPLMEAVESKLEEVGYHVHFFVERRALDWAVAKQPHPSAKTRLRGLCARKEKVTIIQGEKSEADLPMLQAATMLPNSFCISMDRFRDYANAFPGIVGTDRVRKFSFSLLEGDLMLSIDGIQAAIPVSADMECRSSKTEAPIVEPKDSEAAPISVQSVAQTMTGAQRSFQNRQTAIRLLIMAARKCPSKYVELADLFFEAGDEAGMKRGAKLEALGRKRTKSECESRLRDRRRYAEMRRLDHMSTAHLSARRKRFCA